MKKMMLRKNKFYIILYIKLICIEISAVKQLIAINRIQNKSCCLHNICVCVCGVY